MSNTGIDAAVDRMHEMVRMSQYDTTIHAWARLIAGTNSGFVTPASKAKALHDAIKRRVRSMPPRFDEVLHAPHVPPECGLDADEEAVLLSTCCATLGLATKIRAVQVGEYAWTVVVDVQQGLEVVTFKMGEEASDGR